MHAGIPDTWEMLYLGGDKGWGRKDELPHSLGDPMPKPGQSRDPTALRINSGIIGDARRSSAQLGQRLFDMKVDYAVKEIRELLK